MSPTPKPGTIKLPGTSESFGSIRPRPGTISQGEAPFQGMTTQAQYAEGKKARDEGFGRLGNIGQNIASGASLEYYRPEGMTPQPMAEIAGELIPYALAELGTAYLTKGAGNPALTEALAGTRLGGKVMKALPEIAKPISAISKTFPGPTGVVKKLGSIAKTGAPFAAVGAARPADTFEQRKNRAIYEGGLASGIANAPAFARGARKNISGAVSEIFGRMTERDPGVLRTIMKKGYSKVVAPLQKSTMADTLKGMTARASGKLESAVQKLEGKFGGQAGVESRLASTGEKIKTGIETNIDDAMDRIYKEVLSVPEVATKPISTKAVVDRVLSEAAKHQRTEQGALTKVEFEQVLKILTDLENVKDIAGAHDLKQIVYKEAENAYQKPSYSKKIGNIQKIAADELNRQIQSSSPVYEQANKRASDLLGLKKGLKTTLGIGREGQTIEKNLANIDKRDIGTRGMLKQLDDLMPEGDKFLSEVESTVGNKQYQLSKELGKQVSRDVNTGQLSPSEIESISQSIVKGEPAQRHYAIKLIKHLDRETQSKVYASLEKLGVSKEMGPKGYWLRQLIDWPFVNVGLRGGEAVSKLTKFPREIAGKGLKLPVLKNLPQALLTPTTTTKKESY